MGSASALDIIIIKWAPHQQNTRSWMPMGEDWTARIRGAGHVQEYLLIGESGACAPQPIQSMPLAPTPTIGLVCLTLDTHWQATRRAAATRRPRGGPACRPTGSGPTRPTASRAGNWRSCPAGSSRGTTAGPTPATLPRSASAGGRDCGGRRFWWLDGVGWGGLGWDGMGWERRTK